MTVTGMIGASAGLAIAAAHFAPSRLPAARVGHAGTGRVLNIAGLRPSALSPVVGYAVANYAIGD
ncbi:hypothetical protein [Mesorhizobium sp. KR1-2]|uniref:hypothetical protein n=1 Tax=Mesorhizobium sp. KR1-2 TaxID=3156609 RepID=UPI0032B607D0